jgi:hypothetical protein
MGWHTFTLHPLALPLLHPPERRDDVVLFPLSDVRFPAGLNILSGERSEVLISVLKTVKAI